MIGLVEVAAAHVDLQQVVATGARADALLACDEVGGHQGEQVAGFGERVVPGGVVPAAVQVALRGEVAVGQQHRVRRLRSAQSDGVDRHDIGSVEEVGDAAKALGLALGEQAAVRGVQTRQLGVAVGRAGVADVEREGRIRQVVDDELAVLGAEGHALAVDQHAQQGQILAMQLERLRRHSGVALDLHAAGHERLRAVEVEGELDASDEESRRDIVFAAGQGGSAVTHG